MSAPDLHCAVTGSGPDLVLLHPVGLDGALWGGLIERCAPFRRVIAVDQRGHGQSPPARKGATMADYVAGTHAALQRAGVDKAVILGLSFGGMIAQEFAITHPERVSGLMLCGCPGAMPPEARPMILERGLAAERGGMAAVVDGTIERWFTADFRSQPVVETVRKRLLSDDVAGWSAAWTAIADFAALPRLGAVRAPTLVVSGSADVATPFAASTALAAAIPGAELAVLPGASHMMQFEGAEIFAETVTRFLKTAA